VAVREERLQIKGFSVEALRAHFAARGFPAYRAEQVAAWLYGRGVEEPAAMTDLDLAFRRHLEDSWDFSALQLKTHQLSQDGTQKFGLRAADGALFEAVLIPEERRNTLCVSTQIGCPLACAFCATGAMGFLRNLSSAEIIDQVCHVQRLLSPQDKLTNIVFMGMGEPLLNFTALCEAIQLLLHPKAFGFAGRRVTVSTAGVVTRIAPLLRSVKVNLAVSLHAPRDALRDVLVPLNRRFPLALLFDSLRRVPEITARRPVFFEYTLIRDVNDSEADARELIHWVRSLPSKVNLIPMNAHADSDYAPSTPERSERFMAVLATADVTVTLRKNRGADIDAACGQLAARRTEAGGRGCVLPQPEQESRHAVCSG